MKHPQDLQFTACNPKQTQKMFCFYSFYCTSWAEIALYLHWTQSSCLKQNDFAGMCTMIAISWYAANITQQFFDQLYPGTK